jgi:membrane protein DedA with SNARE-associated domain
MKSLITKGRLFAAAVTLILLAAGFLAGAQHGYNLGYLDGENRANGWWIDKKTHYYESAEIKKKRINRKHNHI